MFSLLIVKKNRLTAFIRLSTLGTYLIFGLSAGRLFDVGAYSKWRLFKAGYLLICHHFQPHIFSKFILL